MSMNSRTPSIESWDLSTNTELIGKIFGELTHVKPAIAEDLKARFISQMEREQSRERRLILKLLRDLKYQIKNPTPEQQN